MGCQGCNEAKAGARWHPGAAEPPPDTSPCKGNKPRFKPLPVCFSESKASSPVQNPGASPSSLLLLQPSSAWDSTIPPENLAVS